MLTERMFVLFDSGPRRRPKTSDIPDRVVLNIFSLRPSERHTIGPGHSMPTVSVERFGLLPRKLQLSVMARLIRRGLVDGCACGCRGDFVLTTKGKEAFLAD